MVSGQRLNQQGTVPTHLEEKLHIWLSELHLRRGSDEMKTSKMIKDNLNDMQFRIINIVGMKYPDKVL